MGALFTTVTEGHKEKKLVEGLPTVDLGNQTFVPTEEETKCNN